MTDKIMEARRKAFESWASKDHIDHDGVCYENPYVESAWNGFNAALDSLCVELPERMDATECMEFRKGEYFFDRDIIEAIHAAGVKTK